MTQNITNSVHIYISSSECRKKKMWKKNEYLERGEGRQLNRLLTGWVQHKIRRKTQNAYRHCYQKNLHEASWEAYELLENNIKLNGNNTLEEEIRERIAKGNRAFYANKALFTSKLVSRKSKLKLYWTVIRPVVLYGCENWVLKKKHNPKTLSVWEENIKENIRINKKERWKLEN